MTAPVDTLPVSPGDDKWLGGRTWTALAAVIVLGVLLVAAVSVVLFSGQGSGQPKWAPVHSATVNPSVGGSQDQTLPTSAPSGVTWVLYRGIALPVSLTAGPTSVSGATASGFAHSPTGSLLAAVQFSARVFLAPDTEWLRAVDAMTVPGPGREAWIASRKSQAAGPGVSGTYVQFAGFQFVGYSPQLAVVELANGTAAQGFQASTVTLIWRGSDWKLQQGPDGAAATNGHTIADLSGFIPWSGVS